MRDNLTGKVVKMQGGVVMVYADKKLHACDIKGNLKKTQKILVGDNVVLGKDEYTDERYLITELLPRKNFLPRPPLANLDNLFIVCSTIPKPDLLLLDKMIIYCNINDINPILVINKSDIASVDEINNIKEQYKKVVDEIIVVSGVTGDGVEEIKQKLVGKTSAFTGQSAVGKSTLINKLCPDLDLETNGLSRKTERGKHTTRHNEIFVFPDYFLADTPGFSMLSLKGVDYNNLHLFYKEFSQYEDTCTFLNCAHINCNENVCGVVKAVNKGKISANRYNRYSRLYAQLKEEKEWLYD